MKYKFKVIRIHRTFAAFVGAMIGSGFDLFVGPIFGAAWLIGEIISFVITAEWRDETNS